MDASRGRSVGMKDSLGVYDVFSNGFDASNDMPKKAAGNSVLHISSFDLGLELLLLRLAMSKSTNIPLKDGVKHFTIDAPSQSSDSEVSFPHLTEGLRCLVPKNKNHQDGASCVTSCARRKIL